MNPVRKVTGELRVTEIGKVKSRIGPNLSKPAISIAPRGMLGSCAVNSKRLKPGRKASSKSIIADKLVILNWRYPSSTKSESISISVSLAEKPPAVSSMFPAMVQLRHESRTLSNALACGIKLTIELSGGSNVVFNLLKEIFEDNEQPVAEAVGD